GQVGEEGRVEEDCCRTGLTPASPRAGPSPSGERSGGMVPRTVAVKAGRLAKPSPPNPPLEGEGFDVAAAGARRLDQTQLSTRAGSALRFARRIVSTETGPMTGRTFAGASCRDGDSAMLWSPPASCSPCQTGLSRLPRRC